MTVVEFRTYRLEPGLAASFERLMREHALPLLDQFGIEVVRFALSAIEDEHPAPDAMLVRTFADLDDRERKEEAFYGSDAWRRGPRDAILTCIITYHTVVLELSPEAAAVLGGRPT